MNDGTTTKVKRIIPVYMVVPPYSLLLDIAGPMEVLRYANDLQDDVRFEFHYLADKASVNSSIGLTLDGLQPLPDEIAPDAWVIVSGAMSRHDGDPKVRSARKRISDWLREVVRPDSTLISICSGAILAADAGHFDGHACTTHADCIDALKRAAPLAKVTENRLFVSDGKRHSSAGISTGIDLMLHLTAQETGPAVVTKIAKTMVIYMRRSGSDPQVSPWLTGRNHVHPAIHCVQDAVMQDPGRDWSLERIAALAHMSERNLSRIFRDNSGMSVVDYVNLMRVNLAHDMLSNSRMDIEAIAEKSGFASARHMRRIWQQHHDIPPSHLRKNHKAAGASSAIVNQ